MRIALCWILVVLLLGCSFTTAAAAERWVFLDSNTVQNSTSYAYLDAQTIKLKRLSPSEGLLDAWFKLAQGNKTWIFHEIIDFQSKPTVLRHKVLECYYYENNEKKSVSGEQAWQTVPPGTFIQKYLIKAFIYVNNYMHSQDKPITLS